MNVLSQRTKVLVHTPAFVQNAQHVGMVSVQAKLLPRLRRYLPPAIELVSALIVDDCAPQHRPELERLAAEFDLVKWSIPAAHGTNWGIRKGTNYAVTAVADEVDATHVLRIIQDTFVFDPIAFAQLIKDAVSIPGDWIGAKLEYWATQWHAGLCQEMGLECNGELRYSHGAVMLAPVQTWRDWYVTLPAGINHYWDDIMMSESFRQRKGGLRFDWKACWAHRHGLDELTSNRIAQAHSASTTWSSEGPPMLRTNDNPIPRLGICTIARDEESYIGEWLEFHRLVGVEKFWIYTDDEEGSPMRREIMLRSRGDVTLIPWPRNGGSPQMTAYHHFMTNFPEAAQWIAVIDIDEFLFSPTGADVPSVLATYEDVSYHGGVFVNWAFYGDNGHVHQPQGLTIQNYTRRGIAGSPNSQGKLIVRMGLHPRFPSNPHAAVYVQDGLTINEHRSWVPGADSSPPSIDLLRLNHYFHRSQEEAEKKWRRPGAPGYDIRDPADMARHNLNDIEDTTIPRYLPKLQEAMMHPPLRPTWASGND